MKRLISNRVKNENTMDLFWYFEIPKRVAIRLSQVLKKQRTDYYHGKKISELNVKMTRAKRSELGVSHYVYA